MLFFGRQTPPPPAAFATGTAGAFLIGTALHQLSASSGSKAAECLAAGLLLFYFRMSGEVFLPTVTLATFLAQSGHGGRAFTAPFAYLLAPWLLGHLMLYCAATLSAAFRSSVRHALLPHTQRVGGAADDAARADRVAEAFRRFDVAGDGYLDRHELKLALRWVAEEEVPLDTCERLVHSGCADGSGVLTLHEFSLVCASYCGGGAGRRRAAGGGAGPGP